MTATRKHRLATVEAIARWTATVIAAVAWLFTGLADAVYIRLRQQATTLPSGQVEWHEYGIHGASTYEWTSHPFPPPAPATRPAVEWVGFGGKAPPSRFGISSMRIASSGVPVPLVASIPAVVLWILYYKRRDAAVVGLCKVCSYDLAGLRAGAPCPECGNVPGVGA